MFSHSKAQLDLETRLMTVHYRRFVSNNEDNLPIVPLVAVNSNLAFAAYMRVDNGFGPGTLWVIPTAIKIQQ
jgi:hypothetical protein